MNRKFLQPVNGGSSCLGLENEIGSCSTTIPCPDMCYSNTCKCMYVLIILTQSIQLMYIMQTRRSSYRIIKYMQESFQIVSISHGNNKCMCNIFELCTRWFIPSDLDRQGEMKTWLKYTNIRLRLFCVYNLCSNINIILYAVHILWFYTFDMDNHSVDKSADDFLWLGNIRGE